MDFKTLREKMVQEQIIKRGITDTPVIEVMRRVPRHEFVPLEEIHTAYTDSPISIGEGQTISQPYMVALMTQVLKLQKEDRILEIGTGSGYQTAILAELCHEVYSVEKLESLAERAQYILHELQYHNIHFYIGDGTLGWPEDILFDAIMVTAASPTRLEHLLNQLSENGRMVVPAGDRTTQILTLLSKNNNQIDIKEICHCIFVPLVGKYGWA